MKIKRLSALIKEEVAYSSYVRGGDKFPPRSITLSHFDLRVESEALHFAPKIVPVAHRESPKITDKPTH